MGCFLSPGKGEKPCCDSKALNTFEDYGAMLIFAGQSPALRNLYNERKCKASNSEGKITI